MDFARPHRLEEGVATRSGIKILDSFPRLPSSDEPTNGAAATTTASAAADADATPATGTSEESATTDTKGKNVSSSGSVTKAAGAVPNKLDAMLFDAANRAAKDLFLGPPLTRPRPHPCVQGGDQMTTTTTDGAAIEEPRADEAAEGGNAVEQGSASANVSATQDVEMVDANSNGRKDTSKSSAARAAQRKEEAQEDSDESLCLQEQRRLRLADARLYPERALAPSQIINPGSLVVIFESFDSMSFTYAKPGQAFSNRNGHFAHDDFIGKPYGCKIRSRSSGGLGYVYLLRPTPELWTRSLPHRTQIIHELDAAIIVCQLNLRPNCIVCESGTGSGSMSHSILRTIAPKGKLYTYEYNRSRADAARNEFEKNGVSHLVQVNWRDVCGKNDDATQPGATVETVTESASASNAAKGLEDQQTRIEKGGFGLGPAKAHAIFLDLPEPWLAVPHAAHTIVAGGRIGSYSPCIEQTQRLSAALSKYGFHSVRTMEVRLKEHHVDELELEPPPMVRLPRDPPTLCPGAAAAAEAKTSSQGTAANTTVSTPAPQPKKPAARAPSTVSGNTSTAADFSGEDTGAEADTERSEAETDGEQLMANALVAAARNAQEHGSGLAPMMKKSKNGDGHRVAWEDNSSGQAYHGGNGGNGGNAPSIAAAYDGTKKRKLLIARPFATMRGHTAFLTFATAGNRKWPDPNVADSLGP